MEAEAPVFLDLDGVVLDVSKRYYAVHQDILAQVGGMPVPFEKFWRLKRDKATIEELTGLPKPQAQEYGKRWGQLIEAPAYLELDGYLPQARTAVALLAAKYAVVVVSLRRKGEALRAQLKALTFPKVAQVLSTAARGSSWETKARLIQSSPHFSRNGVVVGDTEADMRAGKELGLTTVGVRGGLRSDALLARESPDVTLEGIRELPAALRALYAGGRP